MTAVAVFMALVACSADTTPGSARPLTQAEWVTVDATRDKWESVSRPLSNDCQGYLGRYQIIDANPDQMLDHCWRCGPSNAAAGIKPDAGDDKCMSVYGRAASCLISTSRCSLGGYLWGDCTAGPVAIISTALTTYAHHRGLTHETVHAIAHCERVPHLTHREPLWDAFL